MKETLMHVHNRVTSVKYERAVSYMSTYYKGGGFHTRAGMSLTKAVDDECDWRPSGGITCNLGEPERIFDLFIRLPVMIHVIVDARTDM